MGDEGPRRGRARGLAVPVGGGGGGGPAEASRRWEMGGVRTRGWCGLNGWLGSGDTPHETRAVWVWAVDSEAHVDASPAFQLLAVTSGATATV